MKFGTLVQHAPGYKMLPQIFIFLPRDLVERCPTARPFSDNYDKPKKQVLDE